MADRRKNNGGHSTKGRAGRKPKANEISMIEKMDATLAPKEVWQKLSNKVKEEDVQAIKTWLSYRYGMPKQSIDHKTNGKKITSIERVIINETSNKDS